jgi:hypothetical protein
MKTFRKLLLLVGLVGVWYVLPSSMTSNLMPSFFGDSNAASSETRDLSGFTSVNAGGRTNVNITLGEDYQIRLQGPERSIKSLETRVSDGNLQISQSGWFNRRSVTIEIVMPTLDGVTASGATTLSVISPLTQEKLRVRSSGASTVKLDTTLDDLDAQSSGASDINIKGYVRHANLRTSGSSDIRGNDFAIDTAIVHLSGSSDIRATVNDSITGAMSGSSSMRIAGSPSIDVSTSGSSTIRTLD